MKEIVELARNLTFQEALARCKENSKLSARRTDDGNGFSVWGEQTYRQVEPPKPSPPIQPRTEHQPVQCYKCSGLGRSNSGNICTLCNGSGQLKYEPPVIPHSLEGDTFPDPPPLQCGGLTQIEIRKILLAQEGHTTGPFGASDNKKWEPCHQCGGDGGATGNCPRCGGNGFEPDTAPSL